MKFKNLLAATVSCVPIILVAGCGTPFSLSNLRKVSVGMTTAEVESIMGAPYQKTPQADGSELWSWRHTDAIMSKRATIVFRNGKAVDVPADPTLKLDSQENITDATVVRIDNFRKTTEFRGPVVKTGRMGMDRILLRAFAEGPHLIRTCQVVFSGYRSSAESWAFYREAYDSNGNKLLLHNVASEVLYTGAVEEQVAVDVTLDYLEKAKTTGIQIRLYGQREQMSLAVGKDYVTGFLAKIEAYQRQEAKQSPDP